MGRSDCPSIQDQQNRNPPIQDTGTDCDAVPDHQNRLPTRTGQPVTIAPPYKNARPCPSIYF